MATEDVIELGSSDEEAEPAPQKIPRKNKPNAMVHIPAGVTLMSAKANTNLNPINKLIGKGVTVTKVNKPVGTNKQSGVYKVNPPLPINGKSVTKSSVQPVIKSTRLPIHNLRQSNPNIKVTPMSMPRFINPISVSKFANNFSHGNALAGTKPMIRPNVVNHIRPKWPSSITLKKTIPIKNNLGNNSTAVKRPSSTNTANVNKKLKISNVQCGEVMTVDLEDDETPATSTASPQWYLRPEELNTNNTTEETDKSSSNVTDEKDSSETDITLENKNNSEPTKFIEITIEDSPIKPISNKKTHEIGAELAITIDDSPVKPPPVKPTSSMNSDDESQETEKSPRHSKKKLNYPKETTSNTIEIEIEPITPVNPELIEENTEETQNIEEPSSKNNEIEIVIPDNVIEVLESPAKVNASPVTTPKKDKKIPQARIKPIHIDENKEPGEFHPVYQEFIDLCLKLENSNDMQTIVEKKIKNYYKQVPKNYTESEEFLELVQSKIMAMTAGPEKLYLYIKDVVDELNLQRKMAKVTPSVKETRNVEAEKFQYGEESEFDPKRQRQIRKLEKTLKKLHRAIQKLEEQEVDFDDEEDSVYLLTERYKERMVRVHAKFCQLTNTKMPSEPRIQIEPRPGQPYGPAKRLEKWVNKKVPIGTPLPFPDFHDVLRCVRDANEEDKLGWNEADIMEEARDLFTRCGKKLQRRRQENEWRLAASRISAEVDPAENNEDLKKKLETNKQLAANKETDVFNKYADKQSQLKLEAVEIGDKEAEESPAEEEDDDVEEVQIVEDVLDDKERRKERIRKLLKSKNKKTDKTDGDKNSSQDDETNTKMVSNDVECKENDSELKNDSTMEVDAVATETNKDDMDIVDSNLDKGKDSNDQSSDENKIDSDMDELHLLQKLHSDNVNTSNVDTTDSESAIDISDTLSSGDNKKPSGDVISIENSSFSESEDKIEDASKDKEMEVDTAEDPEENVSRMVKFDNRDQLSGEVVCSTSDGVQLNKTNNDEYNESVESILLGTSDEDDEGNAKTDDSPKTNNDQCVNLKDDSISIGETVVQTSKEDNTKTMENFAVSPHSDAKIYEGSPENIMNSDNKKTTEVTESTPSDTKTIENNPENILDSDETKSVEIISEFKEISTVKIANNTQESARVETRDIEEIVSLQERNDRKIVIETETSDDSKSSVQIENNLQVKDDSSDSLKLRQKESSSDMVRLDTTKTQDEQKDIETMENFSTLDKHYNSSDQDATINNNTSEPIDNLAVEESNETTGQLKEPAKTTEEVLKKSNETEDGENNTETLESMLKDLQSDLGIPDNLAATSANNELV